MNQQLGRLRVPKVLFMPGEVMARQRIASLPNSPMKGIPNPIDVKEKLRLLEAEREAKQRLQEQEMLEKDKRSSFNRQAHIINKLHQVEQQLEKWKRTRHNLQDRSASNKLVTQQRIEHRQIAYRNKSFSEFESKSNERKKDVERERVQLVNQTRYRNNVNQIDRNVRVMQKKYRTEKKCFTLRKPFYNINDLKNFSQFLF